jgi:hypothetical protein
MIDRMAAALADSPRLGTGIPVIPWRLFMGALEWQLGEHVSIIGPTGTGKSHLGRQLLVRRDYVVTLGTKRRDDTLDAYMRHDGFTRVQSWPPKRPVSDLLRGVRREPGWENRVVLWPSYTGDVAATRERMRTEFSKCFSDVLFNGNRCVDVDEMYYLCAILGLSDYAEEIWTQGRSSGISLLAKTQRPAWVPLFMYDQPAHLFFFADNDETNLRRVGGLGGLSSRVVRETVAGLPKHTCLYVDTRNGHLAVTRVR